MSPISQEKPQRFGISTTGEDIGTALKAAGWGGPNIDLDALMKRVEGLQKIIDGGVRK